MSEQTTPSPFKQPNRQAYRVAAVLLLIAAAILFIVMIVGLVNELQAEAAAEDGPPAVEESFRPAEDAPRFIIRPGARGASF